MSKIRIDNFTLIFYNVSMNRNKTNKISAFAHFLNMLKSDNEIVDFMTEILTEAELETLSKRWQILNLLKEGNTQRDIAEKLKVSLCKVTRGAKILKNKNSVITKYLIKEKNNGSKI